MGASVKVMLSYDYCHFEVCKSTDDDVDNGAIDELRKDCMRLADKAVHQYRIAKEVANIRVNRSGERKVMQRDVERIESKPESERTIGEVAIVKAYRDKNWEEYIEAKYDYQDDWM